MSACLVLLYQWLTPRLAVCHGDPVAVVTVLLGLLGAWWAFVTNGHEADRRHVRRVACMFRRKYAGQRLARLRAELHTTYAGLVVFWRAWRTIPRPIRTVALAVGVLIACSPSGERAPTTPLPASRRDGRDDLGAILDSIDQSRLLARLREYQARGGPKGYDHRALWRAYLVSFLLNLPHTNALIRRLEDDRELRLLCGFSTLPHRTTFNRFIKRLSHHRDLVEGCLAGLTDNLHELLPGFGENVAVDSTAVQSHSNPNRKSRVTKGCSDPEASWGAKTVARGKKTEVEFFWGYKHHLLVDATYGLPIRGHTTTGSRNDSPELVCLLNRAREAHPWMNPAYVMADKAYSSRRNHREVMKLDAVLISPTKRLPGNRLYEGIYTPQGVPTCIGMVEMEHVRSDPKKGHLYRCRREGCHLRTRQGVRYCADEIWENRKDDPRLFGPLRQKSRGWRKLYRLRQSVERVFKSMKESRRLELHCVRGLLNIALHAVMSTLAYTATALYQILTGLQDVRWMVRRVA